VTKKMKNEIIISWKGRWEDLRGCTFANQTSDEEFNPGVGLTRLSNGFDSD